MDQLLADEQVDWSDSDADGEVLWALTDNLGSVRDLIDSNANRRVHRVFDSFGNILGEQRYGAAVDAAFAFTGRYFDSDTGLQNNLNRWYNPETGRWISEDPIGFAAGDANLYRYVGNSPTNYTDPAGLHYPAPWPTRPVASPSPGYPVIVGPNGRVIQKRPMIGPLTAQQTERPNVWVIVSPPYDGPVVGRPQPSSQRTCPPPRDYIDAWFAYWERAAEGQDIAEGIRQYNNRPNCPRPITYSVSR